MNELQIFNNPEFGEIRTINESGTVLFCGSDVARALGYTNTSKALTDHCKGDLTKRYPITDTLGRSQEAIFIPESDLYRLIFRSKLPSAERFTDWVTTEVLPSIRKNGGYIAQQETLSPEELMAKALMVAQQTIADRESQASTSTSATAPSLRPSIRSWAPALPRSRKRHREALRPSLTVHSKYAFLFRI